MHARVLLLAVPLLLAVLLVPRADGAAAAAPFDCSTLRAFFSAETGQNVSDIPVTATINGPSYFPVWFHVPLHQQQTNYTCGPASMHATLLAFGFNVSEEALATEMQTNSDIGTNISQMQLAATARNLAAVFVINTLKEDLRFALSNGQLVIVLYQAWADEPTVPYINVWDSGHFSVLFGMDDVNVYLMDPWTGQYGYIPTDYFMATRWHAPDEYGEYGICVRCALFVGPSATAPLPPRIAVQLAAAPAGLIFVD